VPNDDRPTRAFDPRELAAAGDPSWPLALAALERIGSWANYALRLGTLALLQECVRAMAEQRASPQLIDRAQELLDALRHMSWDQ
jgi:hypothetical protein